MGETNDKVRLKRHIETSYIDETKAQDTVLSCTARLTFTLQANNRK